MKINVQKELDTYLLTISYIVPAGLAETWNLRERPILVLYAGFHS